MERLSTAAPAAPPVHVRRAIAMLGDDSRWGRNTLGQSPGLTISALSSGCIYSIERDSVLVNQVLGSPIAGGLQRLFVRRWVGSALEATELVGPGAISRFDAFVDRFEWNLQWGELELHCSCSLATEVQGWFWRVSARNLSGHPLRIDSILVQDLGLAERSQVRNNEAYTSQYLDHFLADHPALGRVLMTRQNLPQKEGRHPWLLQGCSPRAVAISTDGLQFFGSRCRASGIAEALSRPQIENRVQQYEMGCAAVQSSAAELEPWGSCEWTFFAMYEDDHPSRSSVEDLDRLGALPGLLWPRRVPEAGVRPILRSEADDTHSILQRAELAAAAELSPTALVELFPGPWRHVERIEGQTLSLFYGEPSRHVALLAKELRSRRPHGHVLRAGQGMTPNAQVLSASCYALGALFSQLTVGNTVFGKLLSVMRDPLNLVRSSGLRLLVREHPTAAWQQLGVASAMDMGMNDCHWIYQFQSFCLQVVCTAQPSDPAMVLSFASDQPIELLLVGEVAAGPVEYETSPQLMIDQTAMRLRVQPEARSTLGERHPELSLHIVTATPQAVAAMGGDELLFAEKTAHGYPYLCIATKPTNAFCCTFIGTLGDPAAAEQLCRKYESPEAAADKHPKASWLSLRRRTRLIGAEASDVGEIEESLQWFARDAVVHLATPRGLEQYNGGAWGVRDVCQGPVEMLLSYGQAAATRQILLTLFAHQYQHRGDWPQWFMLPPFQDSQSIHCHSDVLIWPLKALCDYVEHSDDRAILQEPVQYQNEQSLQYTSKRETVLQHTDRLLQRVCEQFIPGLHLPRYGEGDWDDSLQPAEQSLRDRMVSAWTAALLYQTLWRWAAALRRFDQPQRARTIAALAEAIGEDFQRYMLPGGVVSGFVVFDGDPPQPSECLLHPSDRRTGVHYRLIPMTRGIISGVFTPQQAQEHLQLIQRHLLFPDGARLMDRPTSYRGGEEAVFRRSESAAFFGREVGLQYVHAHLRYAEALAVMGQADELLRALLIVNPIAVTRLVPGANLRQRNCYFSSSDADFANRYDAARNYQRLRTGDVGTDGGWRIYSSGPGIYTNIVLRHLFGFRPHFEWIEFDPVLPFQLDGVACEWTQDEKDVRCVYRVRYGNHSPRRVVINGVPAELTATQNPYRRGGVRMSRSAWDQALSLRSNIVQVEL